MIIELQGSIDSMTAPSIQGQVLELWGNHPKVILNLEKVDYLSSAGLRMLLVLYRQVKALNGKICLVGVSEEIKDVMINTGFINFFIISNTLEEGITAII